MLEEPVLKKKRNSGKRYLFFSIIGIFLFVGISYGLVFFIQEYQGSSMGMTTDLLTINITEDGYIRMDSTTGQKDSEGINNNRTTFAITNNNKTPVKVVISIVEEENSTMSNDKVRFVLGDGSGIINIGNLGENKNVLGEINIASGVTANIYTTLWLDYYYEGVNETFSGKYKVEVSNIDEYANSYLVNLVDKNKGLYAINQDGTLNDGTTTDTIVEYRYSGLNPDNYIKFNDEMWRIVSVDSDLIKIVKDEPLVETEFGSDNDFYYDNTIYQVLNEYYENSISEKYKEMIEQEACYTHIDDVKLTDDYTNVVGDSGLCEVKVGSLDARDYLYSTSPSYYTSPLNDTNVSSNTWLTGTYLTMTAITDTTTNVLAINNNVPTSILSTDATYPVKPAVFLNRNVSIVGGNGTKDKPYEIEIVNARTGDMTLGSPI